MPAKILVVDDEPHLRRVVSLYLGARAYQVATAESGTEAIEKVHEDRPDLIIADITMPGMDGYELCSRLRRDPVTRTIPFIFLTAKDQDIDKTKARKVGSDDYLTKPCPLDRLVERVETIIDRIEQARRLPLDRIGLSGRLEEVDVLDLIQMLELEQKTGALVLSHGDRTATLYFRHGVIVEADIRSPKREEPLFVLLGWKAGRYLFLPDAVPERMPITASLAHLLFEDLRALEEHEQKVTVPADASTARLTAGDGQAGKVLAHLETVTRRFRAGRSPTADQQMVRILVAGVARSGRSELIHHLVNDLSMTRWAAVGTDAPTPEYRAEFGLVRLSPETVLHLVAVRAEKRFRPVWEEYLRDALAVLVLVDPSQEEEVKYARMFLKSKETMAPGLPVQVLLPPHAQVPSLPGLDPSRVSSGSLDDRTFRLTILDRLLEQWLTAQQAKKG